MNKPKKKEEPIPKVFYYGKMKLTYDPSLDNRDWGPRVKARMEEVNRMLKNTKLPW